MQSLMLKAANGLKPALIYAMLALLVCGTDGPLVNVAESSVCESQENAPPSERQEEFTTVVRCERARQLKIEQRHLAITFHIPASEQLGHTQKAVLLAPNGHRLSNGLLAPLTC